MEEPTVNPVEGLREEPERQPARPSILGALSWVRDLAFSVLIAVVLIVFIYQPVKVEGTSMEPGLSDNERIFINKFTYKLKLGDVRRGDTVVFWYPPIPASPTSSASSGCPATAFASSTAKSM